MDVHVPLMPINGSLYQGFFCCRRLKLPRLLCYWECKSSTRSLVVPDFRIIEECKGLTPEIPLFSDRLIIKNLLCSRFEAMFQYGWYASGYIIKHPPPFQTPAEYCFPSNPGNCDTCENTAFIRCSWCTQHLWIDDFVKKYHLCEQFVD